MSLILDALRKSEAERRRGQAPGLHTGMSAPPPVRASAWRHAPVLAGGALVLVAVALLLARGQPTGDAQEPTATIDTAAVPPEDGIATVDVTNTAPAPRAAPVDTATPPSTGVAPAAPPTPLPVPARPPPAPATPAVPAAAAPPPIARPPPLPIAAAADTATASPSPAPPVEDALPTLAILSPGERAALPSLKLSMHVWNETPARRFAIVDGQRVVEGAQLGGAIVTQIRRDGVELDVNGRRVLLPRP